MPGGGASFSLLFQLLTSIYILFCSYILYMAEHVHARIKTCSHRNGSRRSNSVKNSFSLTHTPKRTDVRELKLTAHRAFLVQKHGLAQGLGFLPKNSGSMTYFLAQQDALVQESHGIHTTLSVVASAPIANDRFRYRLRMCVLCQTTGSVLACVRALAK